MTGLAISILLVLIASKIDQLLFNFGHYDSGMHGTRVVIRTFVYCVINYFMFGWSWSWLIGSGFIFAAIFDISLNLMRGYSVHYHGSESYWDLALSRVDDVLLLIMRILCFLLGVSIILLLP